jgi:hypothetical protein
MIANFLYPAMKGLAYPVLSTVASCDHLKATAKGYKDGWQMLLDMHDQNEMAMFCISLPKTMSLEQSTILLDGLAQEYTEFSNWPDFADACSDHCGWVPSKNTLAQHIEKSKRSKSA